MPIPELFKMQMESVLNETDSIALYDALQQEAPPVSLRINRAKQVVPSIAKEPVKWCDTGYYLPERPAFAFDPLWHAGCYYVQEASSMFLEQAVKQYVTTSKSVRCLDLCAAPGGKSTHLIALLPEGSLLVSNEVIKTRMNVLAENMQKWGSPRSVVTHNDPADFRQLPHFFDILLTDVPCSGEGMFRKDVQAVHEWSPENVTHCVMRQRKIVQDVWDTLKPGGLLIYSTCTFNKKENEENIRWICDELGADILPLSLNDTWEVTVLSPDLPMYRFFPSRAKGEGFSLALLRKHNGEQLPLPLIKKKRKKAQKQEEYPKEIKEWIGHGEYVFESDGDRLYAVPSILKEDIALLQQTLNVVYSPLLLATRKGKDWIPSQALALSTLLNADAFHTAELTWEQAIRYLRRESIVLSDSVPKGYVLLTYRGVPLGFAKQLQGRANNLYPNEWKIRSGYIPEKTTIL